MVSPGSASSSLDSHPKEKKPEFSRDTISDRLKRQRNNLSKKGLLDLTMMDLKEISKIGSQRSMVTLDVSGSNLTSFADLQPQVKLSEIIAFNCPISSLKGLSKQTKLVSIRFHNTPVSDDPNFRLAALIAIGPKLSYINKQNVSKEERRYADAYPPITKTLLELGWRLQAPIPSKEDFIMICTHYCVPFGDNDVIPKCFPPYPLPQRWVCPSAESFPKPLKQSMVEIVTDRLSQLGFPIRNGEHALQDISAAIDMLVNIAKKTMGEEYDSMDRVQLQESSDHLRDYDVEELQDISHISVSYAD